MHGCINGAPRNCNLLFGYSGILTENVVVALPVISLIDTARSLFADFPDVHPRPAVANSDFVTANRSLRVTCPSRSWEIIFHMENLDCSLDRILRWSQPIGTRDESGRQDLPNAPLSTRP